MDRENPLICVVAGQSDNRIDDSAEETLHDPAAFDLLRRVEYALRGVGAGRLDHDEFKAGADPDVLVACAACSE